MYDLIFPQLSSGDTCLSCPVCSSITKPPECQPFFCPACVGPPNWVQPIDEHGCPVGCPPCGPVLPKCPWWNTRRCKNYTAVRVSI